MSLYVRSRSVQYHSPIDPTLKEYTLTLIIAPSEYETSSIFVVTIMISFEIMFFPDNRPGDLINISTNWVFHIFSMISRFFLFFVVVSISFL